MNAIPTRQGARDVAVPTTPAWSVNPSGERLLIVELQAADRAASNRAARAFAARIAAARLACVIDVVPAMTTVGVHYAPAVVPLDVLHPTPYRALAHQLETLLASVATCETAPARIVEVPVCYGGEFGPDLDEVARRCGLPVEDVIARHSGALVDVMMLGFAPGHPYLGLFDEALAPPRRATPRTAVPPGSIGLANRQSVIYPLTLPGGWNLIGRTPLALFDPSRSVPCLVDAGDQVRFVPITPAQFDALNEYRGALR
jgi:KipI family sensor histidine kinase inhibitor